MKFYCEKFRVFLLNKSFLIQTDHKPLLSWETSRHMEGPLWRWYQTLSQFQFVVEHISGGKNTADCPSRIPRQNDEEFENYNKKVKFENAPIEENTAATTKNITTVNNITVEPVPQSDAINSVLHNVNTPEGEERPKALPGDSLSESDIQNNTPKEQSTSFQIIEKTVLLEAQKNDPVLSVVRKWVGEGKRPETTNKTQKLNPDLKNYRTSFDRLKIIDDVLYRSWESNSNAEPVWLICVIYVNLLCYFID